MIRALGFESFDGPAALSLIERPEPEAGDGVLIDVRAAGVSFPDLLMTQGLYQSLPELPAVPGLEVAGVVREAPAASGLAPGDRVWASLDSGGYAEMVAAEVDRVFRLPDGLDFVAGSALAVNFLTAAFALRRRAGLRPGERVLVLGAAGGLGSASATVAAALGAQVIAVVSSEAKRATAEAAGAAEVIIGGDWRRSVLEATDGAGVNVVVDPVGGEATTEAVRATAAEGRVLVLGFASGEIPAVAGNRLLLRNVGLLGVGLGAMIPSDPGVLRESADLVVDLIEEGLRPVVGATLPLSRGAEALAQLAERKAQGKIVLVTEEPG